MMQTVRDIFVNLGLVLSGACIGVIGILLFLGRIRSELTRLNEYADSVKAKYVEKGIGKKTEAPAKDPTIVELESALAEGDKVLLALLDKMEAENKRLKEQLEQVEGESDRAQINYLHVADERDQLRKQLEGEQDTIAVMEADAEQGDEPYTPLNEVLKETRGEDDDNN